jgi:hypothetical protein
MFQKNSGSFDSVVSTKNPKCRFELDEKNSVVSLNYIEILPRGKF